VVSRRGDKGKPESKKDLSVAVVSDELGREKRGTTYVINYVCF
jgi:hypothetical protein